MCRLRHPAIAVLAVLALDGGPGDAKRARLVVIFLVRVVERANEDVLRVLGQMLAHAVGQVVTGWIGHHASIDRSAGSTAADADLVPRRRAPHFSVMTMRVSWAPSASRCRW